MGAMLERSGIAERLFTAIHFWTRRLPGGLGVGAVVMGTLFAAASGVVGATEAVIGLLAIPVMLKHNYSKSLMSGTICASGSLGTAIPPSITVVVLGPVASVSVGSLFSGLMAPGFLMAVLFLLYIVLVSYLKPEMAPQMPVRRRRHKLGEKRCALPVGVAAYLGTDYDGARYHSAGHSDAYRSRGLRCVGGGYSGLGLPYPES